MAFDAKQIQAAVDALRAGALIAYPTEGVYGLGCDPFNESAIKKLLELKGRSPDKGLILIASCWAHVMPLIAPLSEEVKARVDATWPGPITWLLPANTQAPALVRGNSSKIALRLTDHPVARALCETFEGPIVSTSANLSGHPPATTAAEVDTQFGTQVSHILPGQTGSLTQPTPIRDALTGETVRG